MSFLRRPSTNNSENPDSSIRFRCANRSRTIVAWVFEKEPNAEFADEPEYIPPAAPSVDDIQFILIDMTIIEKLHMLSFERYRREASYMLEHEKIIKIDVQRQFGNVIRVYIYPEQGPMEFISCILKDEADAARLRKVFSFILYVLDHCNCADADLMINLGNLQTDEIDQPLNGSSSILPRLHLKQYKERFSIRVLDWQFDGPIEFYDQLKPETVRYHGSFHSPESAEDLFHNIKAQVQDENNSARRKDKYAAHFLCCIALLCIAPILLLMVVKLCYEIEKTEESIKGLSRLFLQNGRNHFYFDNPHA